jgi:hypothetical protein
MSSLQANLARMTRVVLGAVLLAACSSTVVGAPAGSGDAGPGGSDGGLAASCSAADDDNVCGTCAKAQCCQPLQACRDTPQCPALVTCAGECQTNECLSTCKRTYSAGASAADALASCLGASCNAECGDGSSGAGAISCTSGTLKDPSICPNSHQPFVRDCPNGPPSAGCSVSPTQTGFTNLYCCPS